MKLDKKPQVQPEEGKNRTDGLPAGQKKKGARRKWRKAVVIVLILALLAGGGMYFLGGEQTTAAVGATYTTQQVERRDISSSITGSGTLQAANSYSVTTLVEGTILTDTFEEGDQVEEGSILYTIDSSDTDSSLEQAEISLEQAQRNYNKQVENLEKLDVTAPVSGLVYDVSVEVGDEVSAGQQVAVIRDSDTMCLTVTFPADEAAGFYTGQSAQVTLDSTFETLSGTVSEVSGTDTVLTGNIVVRNVTIDVANPGGLSTTQSASAAVGSVTSTGSGTFTYKAEETVVAEASGEVTAVSVSEGDRVTEGQLLVELSSDDLEDSVQNASESLRNAQLSLDNQYERLDDYTITSPISGTVVDKYYKAGETSESNQVLCSIYDLSYLTMTLNVDELDISSIQVGQSVSVVADAVADKVYEGVVTKVSVAGTSSGSATTYPVTIRIDETEGLLPGMSVDATISLASAEDVLAIPSAALNRGDTVLVTADSPSAVNGTLVESDTEGGEDYYSVAVTTGVTGDEYIEITSGLQEGDVVAYIPTSSSESGFAMMGGMPGGMGGMGGGMPSGGGPGGR